MAGPQIPLTGSIGVAGSAALLGYTEITMTDADYTLSPDEWAGFVIIVSSDGTMTQDRFLICPDNDGQCFVVFNNTTEGFNVLVGISSSDPYPVIIQEYYEDFCTCYSGEGYYGLIADQPTNNTGWSFSYPDNYSAIATIVNPSSDVNNSLTIRSPLDGVEPGSIYLQASANVGETNHIGLNLFLADGTTPEIDVLLGVTGTTYPIRFTISPNDSDKPPALLFTDISDSSVDEISSDEGLNIYSPNGVYVVSENGFVVYYDNSFTGGVGISADGVDGIIELFGSGTLLIEGTIVDIDALTSISLDAPTVQLGPLIGVNFTHTTIASASLLEPASSFVTISGTTAIANINPPNGAGNILIAVASGLWTTTTGGNIATAVTAVVGEVYLFVFDGTSWDVLQTGSGGGSSFPSGITTDTIASYTADTAIDLSNGGNGIQFIDPSDGSVDTIAANEGLKITTEDGLYVVSPLLGVYADDTFDVGIQFEVSSGLARIACPGLPSLSFYATGSISFSTPTVALGGTLSMLQTFSAIPSATTISPVNSIIHISGTSPIATITPNSGGLGQILYIIADGAWTTTTAGNIYAAMTAVSGTLYTAVYDGSKWYIK